MCACVSQKESVSGRTSCVLSIIDFKGGKERAGGQNYREPHITCSNLSSSSPFAYRTNYVGQTS